MTNQELSPKSLEKMIYGALESILTEINNDTEGTVFKDKHCAFPSLNELAEYLPKTLAAANVPGNSVQFETTEEGAILKIDATVGIELDSDGRLVCSLPACVKYFMIFIDYKRVNKNDKFVHEFDITTEYREVEYPELNGLTSLPEPLDSKILRSGQYYIFTLDDSGELLKFTCKKNYADGIYWIFDWKKS